MFRIDEGSRIVCRVNCVHFYHSYVILTLFRVIQGVQYNMEMLSSEIPVYVKCKCIENLSTVH